jgi:hypothetical protein
MADLIDLNAPNRRTGELIPAEELPRGLIQPPQRVLDLVARQAAKFPINDEEKTRITEDFTLQYYYQDWYIVYRRTPQGVEVLAVGLPEIAALVNHLTPEERRTVITKLV